ncbi:MAG: ABC transporter permease [Bacteroidota bacterium]
MLFYQIKQSFRVLYRQKFFTFINLAGLTTAMATVLLIFLWVQDEFTIDKFHEKDDRLYQVMAMQSYPSGNAVSLSTPGLLGETIKKDFPDIQYSVTTTWIHSVLLSHENTFLREEGYHAGKDFFQIFTYPLLAGDPNTVLVDPTSICISRDLANKLFGDVENAMGKSIRYAEDRNFTVSGVFENINEKSTYQFDFVLPLQDFLDRATWATNWANTGPPTYVVLQEGTNAQATSKKIAGYLKTKVADSNQELFLKKYSDQYLQGRYTNGVPDGGRIDYVRLFSIIGIFIIVIACINFMNLSTARASKRAQEVGIRKAIGAGRGRLIRQYIGESVLISFLSMLLSFVLVLIFLAPFNQITGKSIGLSLSTELIVVSLATVFVTGLLAGSYPAFYLSHFRPIQVIKNEIKNSIGEVWARKGLVVFQFTVTIMLIIGVVVIDRQTEYLNSKPLGYNRDNVILFSQDGDIYDRSETFFSELKKLPGVVQAGSTSHSLIGQVSSNPGVEWDGKAPEQQTVFERFFVDYDLYETMEFQMASGRWFSRKFASDSSKIIINEAALVAMGFSAEEAIGKQIGLSEDFQLEIIGVLKDFHYRSLHSPVGPAYFRMASTGNVVARLESGREAEALAEIKTLYQKFAPGFIFDYAFLDSSYQALYESEQRVSTLSSYFAIFAILISCLGLFGLATFTAERRIKEIGIRKVLGASVTGIVALLSKDFIKLVGIAFIIATPIAWYLMNDWLQDFAYQIQLQWWVFALAGIGAIGIALLTVSFQSLKAALTNPIDSLRNE